MSQKFTQAFKMQAVEKALSRAEGVSKSRNNFIGSILVQITLYYYNKVSL